MFTMGRHAIRVMAGTSHTLSQYRRPVEKHRCGRACCDEELVDPVVFLVVWPALPAHRALRAVFAKGWLLM